MNARHLVVDLGGVLFYFDHAERLSRLAAASGMPHEQVHALLWESGISAGFDEGRFGSADEGRFGSADEVRAQVRATIGLAGSDDELDELWCSAYRPNEAVVELLGGRGADVALSVFTNNGPLEEAALTSRYPDAFAPFGRLVFSHRLGCRKLHPVAFDAAAALLATDPADILLIDDSPANVAAACAAGWQAVQFHEPGDLVRTLSGAAPGRVE